MLGELDVLDVLDVLDMLEGDGKVGNEACGDGWVAKWSSNIMDMAAAP